VTGFARPLDRFPLVRTRNVEEMLAALAPIYAKPAWRFEGNCKTADVTLNYRPLRHLGLGYTKYGTGIAEPIPRARFFCKHFPFADAGKQPSAALPARLVSSAA